MHPYHRVVDRLSKTIYVILMKDSDGKVTLLADPGLGKPWSSHNKKLADFHASQCDGETHTWESAFRILNKAYPRLEHDLTDRIARATTVRHPRVKPTPGSGPVTDSSGNPLH